MRLLNIKLLRWLPFAFALALALAAVFSAPHPALADGVISGTVSDKELLVPVEGVEVIIEGKEKSVATDEEGKFEFPSLPDGDYKVIFQSEKHERLTRDVSVKGADVALDVDVKKAKGAVELSEVSVSARREPVAVAKQTLEKEEIMTVPGAGADAIRVVESLPGVANIGPQGMGTPGLVIRGTGAEDSAYMIDGFFIPQLFHFGGLLTVVNSEWLESLDYYAGGYSTKYTNALGGIVEINTRLPKDDKFSGIADLTNYSSFVLAEGPFGKDTGWSGGAAVRRSFIDFILPMFISGEQAQFTMLPRFYDYQVNIAYKPNAVNTFRLFGFGSDDRMGLVSPETSKESPTSKQSFDMTVLFHTPILSWTLTPTSKINNRLAVSPLVQSAKVDVFEDKFVKISAEVLGLRDDFTAEMAKWSTLSTGFLGYINRLTAEMNIIRPPKEGNPTGMELFNDKSYLFKEGINLQWGMVYLENTFKIGSRLSLTPGANAFYGQFTLDRSGQSMSMFYWDPRSFARFHLTDRATIKGSAGIYHAPPKGDEMIEPFGTLNLKAEEADAYGGGVEYDFGHGYTLDVQGYYKWMHDLVAVTGPDAAEPYNNKGVGKIYGAEVLARKQLTDRLYGWISYTYTESRRRDQPGADWRWFDQDQRHNFIILASYKLGDTWRLGGRWSYATGLPYTPIDSAIYNVDADSYTPIYSDKINSKRDVPLHKLDLRVDKLWQFKRWQLTSYLDVQNAYYAPQPVGYMYNYDYTEKKMVSFPTFYPTLGLAARW